MSPTAGSAFAAPESIAQVLEFLRRSFQADAVGDLRATYQIELSGESGGIFWARVEGSNLSCDEGRTPSPDVVFELAASDFYDVLAGSANPELLHMEGRIRVTGSLSLALKLRVMFLAGEPS